MATATINMLYCVSAATGIDSGVNTALSNLAPTLPLSELGTDASSAIQSAVQAVPGLLQAIDVARQDPDQLYVTSDTAAGVDHAIWPGNGTTQDTQAGQSHDAGLTLEFSDNMNISLWDYDSFSDDDLLGSVTILESEAGTGDVAKLASSVVEGSAYYVVYRVD